MSSYPPRSKVKQLKRKKLYKEKDSPELNEDKESTISNTLDVLSLPSRKDIHKEKKYQKIKNNRTPKKKSNFQFPLVRILLVLFILLVSGMFIYSFLAR
ncbi:hypothetical protein ACERII_02225 [Evansella sp. AB-rgal1]|uniref:hypothetical protein n=1 Tax=Evansella sp. AB-rgal1 TaxID=3242696 RepID=UPI00359D38E1